LRESRGPPQPNFDREGACVELSWFRRPGEAGAGTLNLCFNAVDRHVVHGAATETAVRDGATTLDFARLLQDVAALAGTMRNLGVAPGAAVGVALDDDLERLLVLLACLRLGAVYVEGDLTPRETHLVVEPGAVQPAVRAGRTDPAPCAELAPGTTAYVLDGEAVLLADAADHPSWAGRVCATLCAAQPLDLTGDRA
jgi:non-ribosomal peptide synthetase component E (peptide arylation enzyme)